MHLRLRECLRVHNPFLFDHPAGDKEVVVGGGMVNTLMTTASATGKQMSPRRSMLYRQIYVYRSIYLSIE
eukprot:5969976-Alexandrium_andersonii.AAC.1